MNNENTIILGGGCFWCLEAAYQRLAGVTQVISGYAGGSKETANYREVCSGMTQHAEVVQIEWQPDVVELDKILATFFMLHDATTLNRQGNDIGPQYRSYIGYNLANHLPKIQAVIDSQQKACPAGKNIVTELQFAPHFYPAEQNQQDYYNRNRQQPYCQIMIKPKLDKMR